MTAGLLKASKLVPGSGWAALTASVAGQGLGSPAVEARAELGWKPSASSTLFAFTAAQAQLNQPLAWQAGLGARVEW